MSDPLCCCEYIDLNNERNHILGCCCNCVELDLVADRLLTCTKVPDKLFARVMATASDRLRFPWRGGAKHFSLDAVLPVFLLPILILTAAQGVWISVVMFTFLPLFLMYLYFICISCNPQTSFFFVWAVASVMTTFVIFEFVGVRLLEIRTDENFIFTFLTSSVLFCIYKVKQKSHLSFVTNSESAADTSQGKMSVLCSACNIKVPARAFHCHICQVCILKRDQHCIWLNCCIGQSNHRWYMLLLLMSISQLVLCSNLILTTACHPFRVWGAIMLPDDCSDVYFDTIYAVCFVTALYCLEGSLFLVSIWIHEFWLISLGMTGHEWRNRGKWSRCCGLFSSRPHSKGFLQNWLRYCRGVDVSLSSHDI